VGLDPGEGGFFSLETKHSKKQHQEQNCVFQQGDYMNKHCSPQKLPWVQITVRMVSVAWKQSMIKNGAKTKVVCFG
jgi:hypothetical protein